MPGVLTPSARSNRLVDSAGNVRTKEPIELTPTFAFSLEDEPPLHTEGAASTAPLALTDAADARGAVTFASVLDVLTWRSSASLPAFCAAHVLLLAAASASATATLTFCAKLVVAGIALGFVRRHVLGAPPQLGPISADEIAAVAARCEWAVNAALQLANAVFTAQDLRLSILVVCSLYAYTVAASLMSVGTMAYVTFAAAFGAAPLHRLAHAQVQQALAFAEREAAALIRALGFKHVLALTAAALVGWPLVGAWTKFVALLLVLMALTMNGALPKQNRERSL
ncbi:hypothetical protein KFE25_002649 [Diacronema lutheri]|uniref:Reticulon-like protein n=1 Tax=Diacronema lutheri TaxID=2081491 RepID=A0A8J5XJ94_DIALT|nr:hypothetical protein KFE25_002649 [Diacronema lutheri]